MSDKERIKELEEQIEHLRQAIANLVSCAHVVQRIIAGENE